MRDSARQISIAEKHERAKINETSMRKIPCPVVVYWTGSSLLGVGFYTQESYGETGQSRQLMVCSN
jgi:hypothetical protein